GLRRPYRNGRQTRLKRADNAIYRVPMVIGAQSMVVVQGCATFLSALAAFMTCRAASALRAAIASPTIRSGQTDRVAAVAKPAATMATLASTSLRADRQAARVKLQL